MHSITVVTINAEMRYYCRLDKFGMHQNEKVSGVAYEQ